MAGTGEQLARPFAVGFERSPATGGPVVLRVSASWLGGNLTESLFSGTEHMGTEDGVELHRSGGLLLGVAQQPFVADALAELTQSLYARVLRLARGRHLLRIWNYVPEINADTAGLENYRAFCLGRSMAFEQGLGAGFASRLPAASAVGCDGNSLQIVFVAGETAPRHFENPAQIPAYQYPAEHGPRSPSFARATVARAGEASWTFISGTAAIRGHETVAPGALEAQLDCTIENLRIIGAECGLGPNLQGSAGVRRHFKVYLRHGSDFPAARARLESSLFRPGDRVIYLRSDICRAALNVEIEVTAVE